MLRDLHLPIEPYWTLDKGLSFSSLCKWIVCPHRFFLYAIAGLQEPQTFQYRIEFGSFIHKLLEHNGQRKPLDSYVKELLAKYPTQATEIAFWKTVALRYFPVMQEYAATHKTKLPNGVTTVTEQEFQITLNVASNENNNEPIVIIGGVDAIHTLPKKRLYIIQENKFRGEYNPEQVTATLPHDLQTMLYVTCLQQLHGFERCSILYNVGIRPLGDRYALRQSKKESASQFIDRIFDTQPKKPGSMYPITANVAKWFHRSEVAIGPDEIAAFKQRMLFPLLRSFLAWYYSLPQKKGRFDNPFQSPLHRVTPFGVYNPLADGRSGDYYQQIALGASHNRLEKRVHRV